MVDETTTKSEATRDGLRASQAPDRAVENWLREQVAPAYDAIQADPARAVPVARVRMTLAGEHERASKAR